MASCLLIATALSTLAQQTGTVMGRVYNPATGEYVRNAEIRLKGTEQMTLSEDGGFYRLPNVPAGPATITVTYTGFETTEAAVQVPADSSAEQDFTLQVRKQATATAETLLTLDEFVVVSDRSGQAKAIQEQKNAMNITNVVATDVFGDIAEGNVGEFLKFMPGISLDYVEADTRAASIGGLDAKYAGVTMDGAALASAASSSFGDSSRQFEFEQVSINSIETIEVNKTLSADMDGDTPAGTINLRTKSAFDQKGRRFSYNVSFSANSYEMTLARTDGPGDEPSRKVRPNAVIDYSDVFFRNRVGIRLTLSHNESYKKQYRLSHNFTGPGSNPTGINRITYKDGPKLTQRDSATLRVDFKLGPRTSVRWMGTYGKFDDDIHNRNFTFRAEAAQIQAGSGLTRISAVPSTNANTRLETGGDSFHKIGDTVGTNGEFNTRWNNFRFDVKGAYSVSKNRYEDTPSGYFGSIAARITRIGWLAERSKASSTGWNIAQTQGADWTNLDNWNRIDNNANNVETNGRKSKTQLYTGEANLRYDAKWRIPTWFKTGIKTRLHVRDVNDPTFRKRWTYVGPAGGTSTINATGMIPSSFEFDPEKGGNIGLLNLPYPSRKGMYELFKEHPEYFVPTTGTAGGDDLRAMAGANRDIKEQVSSVYLMANAKPMRRLEVQAGVRVEQTKQHLTIVTPLTEAEMTALGFPISQSDTADYIARRYAEPRRVKKNELTHTMPSASAKYRITPNLVAHTAYSKSIGRPNINRLAGAWVIDDDDLEVTLPNPNLKPEPFHTYSGRLEYYFEPAGSFTAGYFERHSKSLQTEPELIEGPELDLLLEGRPDLAGYDFFVIRDTNRTKRLNKSIELEYTQQFSFLPKPFNGLSGFVTFTRNIPDYLRRTPPKVITSGLGYAYRGFNFRIKSTWQARTYESNTRTRHARFLVDVDSSYRITRWLTVFASGRNVFNEPISWHVRGHPNNLQQHEQFGVLWTLGVRGVF